MAVSLQNQLKDELEQAGQALHTHISIYSLPNETPYSNCTDEEARRTRSRPAAPADSSGSRTETVCTALYSERPLHALQAVQEFRKLRDARAQQDGGVVPEELVEQDIQALDECEGHAVDRFTHVLGLIAVRIGTVRREAMLLMMRLYISR